MSSTIPLSMEWGMHALTSKTNDIKDRVLQRLSLRGWQQFRRWLWCDHTALRAQVSGSLNIGTCILQYWNSASTDSCSQYTDLQHNSPSSEGSDKTIWKRDIKCQRHHLPVHGVVAADLLAIDAL
jgi:hypothetical protein